MSEDQGFYKLSNLVTEALEFRSKVMAALGNPDDEIAENDDEIIAKIKGLIEIDKSISAIKDFDAKPIEDGAYYKIGVHQYTAIVCFAARVRNALQSHGKTLTDHEVIAEIERLQNVDTESSQFRVNIKEILIELAKLNGYCLDGITDEQAILKVQQLASTSNDFEYAQYKSSFRSLKRVYFIIAELLGVNNDDEIIAKIKGLQEFSINAKKALPENGALSDDAFIDSVYELRSERTYYRSILDHLCNRLELHSADAFEKLKQVEVGGLKSFATLEAEKQQLKHEYCQKVDEYHQEVSSLVDKLRIANKVIARLVGE